MDQITKQERQAAKAVNFGLVFGMGSNGLKAYAKETYGVNMTDDEAKRFRRKFFESYKGIASWHQKMKREQPTVSRTLSGRKHTYKKGAGLSGLLNTPIQGSASDILKQALGLLVVALRTTTTKIVAIIHDEIVLECDEQSAEITAQLLKDTMALAGTRYMSDVPTIVDVSIADSWAEK
jgi:DNA polymerase-1